MKKILIILLLIPSLIWGAVTFKNGVRVDETADYFELREVTNNEAVCNDGKLANYWIAKQDSDKWLIQFPGGGSGWPAKYFKNRDQFLKSPVSKDHNNRFLKSSGIAEQFFSMGYNVIWLHYCSSDNYGGNHFNLIDGQQVPFKGKLIVDSIINEHKKDLENSTDLVVAGTSAGTYGIIFNIHLISKFKPKLILDGIWRDDFQKSDEVEKQDWFYQTDDFVPYLWGELPDHCNGDFYNGCWIDRKTLDKHDIKKAFIIMNYGDPYNFVNKEEQIEKFIASFKSDAEYFGGGYSINAKKFQLEGQQKWGHGLLIPNDDYNKKIDGVSLSSLIEQWIGGESPIFIRY